MFFGIGLSLLSKHKYEVFLEYVSDKPVRRFVFLDAHKNVALSQRRKPIKMEVEQSSNFRIFE